MPRARHRFERAQSAPEVAWGTALPATYVWPGLRTVRYQPTDVVVRAEKLNGSLALSDGADVMGKSAAAVLGGYLCPQTFPRLLQGATHQVAPTADAGMPPAQTRVYAPTLTAEDTPVSLALEVGSNIVQDQWLIPGALPASFTLSGRIGEFAMFEANYLGKALQPHALTAPLTAGDYTRLSAKNAKFFVDDITGTIGTTEVAGCITEFAFNSGGLWALVNCIDGSLEASGYSQVEQDPSLVITIQLGDDTLAWFNAMQSGAQKLVRLQLPGVEIHPGPPAVVAEMIQIDLAANITAFPEVGDTEAENGLVAAITFSGSEDNTGGSFGKLIEYTVVSADATLP